MIKFTHSREMIGAEYVDPDLIAALQKSWSRESAWPVSQQDWTPDNSSWGNCFVTTLLLWHEMGGQLIPGNAYIPGDDKPAWHFQLDLNDQRIDLTWQQFPEGTVFQSCSHGSEDFKIHMVGSVAEDESLIPRLNVLLDNLLYKGGYYIPGDGTEIVKKVMTTYPDILTIPQARVYRPVIGFSLSRPDRF